MSRRPPNEDRSECAALVTLYESNVDDLYRFCLARTGSRQLAEDATSEAFLAAARTHAAGNGAEVDRPWLFVVARRRIVDQWRATERHRRRTERMRHHSTTAGAYEDSDLLDDGTSERVLSALRSLPTRQRAALTLRYLDEYSVTEVAEALTIEYRAAESLLARGRRSFSTAWHALAAVHYEGWNH